ncbi:uncharacterized protein PHACADRAFT_137955 [Phanerochaete carnosa HHB-10118-sp]|uniref:Up-regulated during septation protein 1 domain-containing protein n=1 Tax=Phanerochaete carnosa (strain HHB-10118-sp) TaxID=650164 RepID=K5WKS8_PHACS|nr:uncharacterized protein PHACADRAFT_137955 [Phanerochaete carnosa HHB-10118-sp]EKM59769.1 hypothetical protein PHACADRAFT_137955 [Phanerochaete carnosa HHB-10118-sp]
MNGVRRFLGGGSSSTPSTPEPASPPAHPGTAPLLFSGKPNWPPASPTESNYSPSPPTTAALSFAKKKPTVPPEDDVGNSSFSSSRSSGSAVSPVRQTSYFNLPQSPGAGPSSPPKHNRVSQLARKAVAGGNESKRSSQMLNIRDDLLIDLLASEAIVDSRGYEILSAEEVEELKKEQQVLSSRLVAMNKKLTLETKIRGAAASLSKANAAYKSVNKQTSEQLDAANRKVEAAQKELWRVSERANEIQRKLLEHRAGVLSHSVHNLERKTAPQDASDISGHSTPSRSSQLSPVTASSATSVQTVSSKGRFDGAHFFAGHSDAILPHSPSALPNGGPSAELEEKLREATAALEAAAAVQMEMEQELSMVRLEKEEMETSLGVELRTAQDSVRDLEEQLASVANVQMQLQAMEEERSVWMNERIELEERRQEVRELKRKVDELQASHGEAAAASEGALAAAAGVHLVEMQKKEEELQMMRSQWEEERATWSLEKANMMGDLNEHVAKLQNDAVVGSGSKAQLNEVSRTLGSLAQAHGLDVAASAAPVVLATALGKHVGDLRSQIDEHALEQEQWHSESSHLEVDNRDLSDRCQALAQQLEDAQRERDKTKEELRSMEIQLQAQTAAAIAAVNTSSQPPVQYDGDVGKIIAQLQPVWATLPSTEARASKLGTRSFRTGSSSPMGSPVSSRGGVPASLSEMDVRSLKSLYDPKGFALAMNSAPFTIEAFVERIQALIADDRALVERLIRFAQAHDLLKKNAERAQKLAQDSNVALETYQKQVRTLEERNISLMTQHAELCVIIYSLHDEVQWLQEQIERLQSEKLEIETRAAEQAETCAQLTEANNQLSAKALLMANEAASTTDSVRRQLEMQLNETRAALVKAKEELESIQQSQQTQQMALLEALNTAQTENDMLRNQLRAKK